MARIAGIDLPRDKRVDIGLTYVFGIGRATAVLILKKAGVDPAIRVKDLSEDQIVKLRETIDRDHDVLVHDADGATTTCAIACGHEALCGPRRTRDRLRRRVEGWSNDQQPGWR